MPESVPAVPVVTVSHELFETAVQEQLGVVCRLKDPLPPPSGILAADEVREYMQAGAARTVKLWVTVVAAP